MQATAGFYHQRLTLCILVRTHQYLPVFTHWTIPVFLNFASFVSLWNCNDVWQWSLSKDALKGQNPVSISIRSVSLPLTSENSLINSPWINYSVTYWLIGRPRPVTIKATKYIVHWPRKIQAQLLLVTDHHASVYPNSARPDEKETIRTPVMEFASVFDLKQPWQW